MCKSNQLLLLLHFYSIQTFGHACVCVHHYMKRFILFIYKYRFSFRSIHFVYFGFVRAIVGFEGNINSCCYCCSHLPNVSKTPNHFPLCSLGILFTSRFVPHTVVLCTFSSLWYIFHRPVNEKMRVRSTSTMARMHVSILVRFVDNSDNIFVVWLHSEMCISF